MKDKLKSLHRKARKIFSECIRRSEKGKCFTCGVKKDFKKQNCGHFIHKDCLDFSELGNHCQCRRCNLYLRGNLGIYAIKLIKEYGLKVVEELIKEGNRNHKFTIAKLDAIIDYYSEEIKKLNKYAKSKTK